MKKDFVLHEFEVSARIESMFSSMPEDDLDLGLKGLGLPEGREKILKEVLVGSRRLDIVDGIDIKLYALKKMFPSKYDSLMLKETVFSKSDLCHYDPVKNGQNMIKHGLSFREVINFSPRFATLAVPGVESNGEKRSVILSDLSLPKGYSLSLPLEEWGERLNFYTLTVAQVRGFTYRMISSRVLSRRNVSKALKGAFKNIYPDSAERKKEFVSHCVEILRCNFKDDFK